MSSIFDFEDKSSLDSEFLVPAEAQFPDDDDMEAPSKAKYAVRGDFLVHSIRGTKNAGSPGRHVVNLRCSVENNDDYDGGGEQAWWFEADDFDGQWGDISKKQVAALARLVVNAGLVDKGAFDGLSPIDAVEVIIDAGSRYQKSSKYKFGGMLQWVKTKKPDGRVFINTNLYINNCPVTELPF